MHDGPAMKPIEPTAAVLRGTGESAVFAIRDLSAGGARLVGPLRLFEGERIQLQLELEGRPTVLAEVVKFDAQRAVAEVAFRELSAEALAQIERSIAEVVSRVDETSRPTVLVVHPEVEISSALERDLARIAIATRVATNMAQLVAQLEDRNVRYIGAIVAGSLADVGQMLLYLEEHHGTLSRVLLFGDQIEKLDHPSSGRVHAVLRTPWRFKGLARAVDVSIHNVVTTYDQLVALKMPIEDD